MGKYTSTHLTRLLFKQTKSAKNVGDEQDKSK